MSPLNLTRGMPVSQSPRNAESIFVQVLSFIPASEDTEIWKVESSLTMAMTLLATNRVIRLSEHFERLQSFSEVRSTTVRPGGYSIPLRLYCLASSFSHEALQKRIAKSNNFTFIIYLYFILLIFV